MLQATKKAALGVLLLGLLASARLARADDNLCQVGSGEFASTKTCASSASPKLGKVVPTFHSAGLYLVSGDPGAGNQIFVRYRKAKDDPSVSASWKQGHPMWYDARSDSSLGLPYTDSDGTSYRARSSVVMLEPGTRYVFEIGVASATTDFMSVGYQYQLVGTTWNETFPEAPNPTTIPNQSGVYLIETGGSDTGYKVYDGWNAGTNSKNTINRVTTDAQGNQTVEGVNDALGNGDENTGSTTMDKYHAIVVRASFVIIRRVRVHGAALSAIKVAPNVTHVVIEDTQIDDWAWHKGNTSTDHPANPNAWGTWGFNEAAAIKLAGGNSRIVIQRNIIQNPHYGSYPWDAGLNPGDGGHCTAGDGPTDHPSGPNGISVQEGAGENVIRYNEITGDAAGQKWYQDGIGGGNNDSALGSPGRDSDIYQNIVMNVFDDAIEAEGGGLNVREWGNFLADTKTGLASTPAHFGPLYAWRNVMTRLRECYLGQTNPDNDWSPSGFKWGAFQSPYGGGMRYAYHNTILQKVVSTSTYGLGPVVGMEGPDGGVITTTTRNNLFHVKKTDWHANGVSQNGGCSIEGDDSISNSSFASDAYNGQLCNGVTESGSAVHFMSSTENPSVTGVPRINYQADNGPAAPDPSLGGGGAGSYRLAAGSAGYEAGAVIPNFSDGYKAGSLPDMGAHDSNNPDPMTFGVTATTGKAANPPPTASLVTTPAADSTGTVSGTVSGTATFHVAFDGSGSHANSPATSITYDMDFGDQSAHVTASTSAHDYAAGHYIARLTVTDNNGLQASQQVNVQVSQTATPPTASLATSPAAASGTVTVQSPFTVSFTGSGSATAPATITEYRLDYGDQSSPYVSTTTPPSNVQHTYVASGTPYSATFKVTDSNNATAQQSVQVVTDTSQQPGNPTNPLELNVSVNPNLAVDSAAGEGFAISLQATDARALPSISIYVDGVLKASNVTSFTWTPTPADVGNHVLRVDASDAASPPHTASESRTLTVLGDVCAVYTSAGSVTQGDTVTVQGVCSGTKTVTEMEFYVDGNLQGSDPTSSYTWTVDTGKLAPGSHTLAVKGKFVSPTAEASASAAVDVAAPILSLSFSPGTTVLSDEHTTITASVTDGRQVKQIDFWIDGAFKAGTIVPPYQYQWAAGGGADVGRHTLLVQATDVNGNVLSTTRDLLVTSHTCSLLVGSTRYHQASDDTIYVMPHRVAQGQRVSMRSECSAWASINRVEYYLNGVLQATTTGVPYAWSLDTSNLTVGQTYTLSTKGYLTNGAVSNDAATIEIVAP